MKKVFIGLILIVFTFGLWDSGLLSRGWEQLANSRISSQLKDSVQSSEFLPGPLRGSFDADNTVLTRKGTIEATNAQRALNGLIPLHSNEKLNKAAEVKLNDMFNGQYFEHNSPDGKTPADVIKGANYEYIVVGENLALGNFKNDELLVEAWMNSPGHRANILHTKFQEIGVAARKGTFEGREVWMAVQEFGTPLSSCPSPSAMMQEQIKLNRSQIDSWQTELAQRKKQLDSGRYSSKSEYDEKIDEYNALAGKTNRLIDDTRQLVESYNKDVNDFNQCLEENV